jgi:hypothetical protein
MTSKFIHNAGAVLLALTAWPAVTRGEPPESRVEPLRQYPQATPASLTPAASHPFASMAGNWVGGGTIELTNDIKENLRCRVSYNYTASNNGLGLSIRCASDNYKVELNSNVIDRNGHISGQFTEANYKLSGGISGQVNGGRITATAKGDNFTAALAVNTSGNHQTVTITPEATYLISIKLALSKVGGAPAGPKTAVAR